MFNIDKSPFFSFSFPFDVTVCVCVSFYVAFAATDDGVVVFLLPFCISLAWYILIRTFSFNRIYPVWVELNRNWVVYAAYYGFYYVYRCPLPILRFHFLGVRIHCHRPFFSLPFSVHFIWICSLHSLVHLFLPFV